MAAGAAAIAAAIAQAVKASGTLVRMEPAEFLKILARAETPLVVVATGGFITKNFQYLTTYRGLAFFTKSPDPLMLPPRAEIVQARGIWMPN